ncbi:MAG: DNA polymerase I [Anaerolineae bacterium]|nr:DNA polymerase I [Anaerolineae bacterium]
MAPMFYILDGHALAYRHYFAMGKVSSFSTSGGKPTSAIYGFAKALMDILEKDQPAYIAVTFDEGLSGREELYPEYKAQREAMPDDLRVQIGQIQTLVEAFNIPVLTQPNTEADDIIGTVSRQAETQGVDVRIVTGDRDIFQLINDHVTVRYSTSQPKAPVEIYDLVRFRERFGFEPPQLIDYKALVGDASDNIPGVAGVGEKTATDLIQTYGTLDNIYANIALIKGAVAKKLEAGRDSAYLSHKLATIRCDIPITLDLNLCVSHDFDRAKVEALFTDFEFKSLFTQLGRIRARDGAAEAHKTKRTKDEQLSLFDMLTGAETAVDAPIESLAKTEIITTASELADLAAKLNAADAIAFDTETTGTDSLLAQLVGISLACDGETGYYIPVGHDHGEQLSLAAVIEALHPALTNPNIGKYAHNADYDLVVLQRHGIEVTPITFDSMIAAWLVDSREQIGLKALVKGKLGLSMTTIDELIGTGKNQLTMDRVAIERAAPYAGDDAAMTYRLVETLRPELANAPGDPEFDALWQVPLRPRSYVLEHIEMPLVPVIAAIEQTGVVIDVPYLLDLSVRLTEQLTAIENEVFDLSGGYGRFNINSPKQLNDVLFGKLGLSPKGVRKTTHGFSTDAATLDNMRGDHPIIDKILEYRELSKLKGTYVDAFPAMINPTSGRLHTQYNQVGASTGRMSSSNPNLQNIPNRTEVGREVRRAFIAAPGTRLLSVDYSQVELRIMAHVTKEPTLLRAFEEGQDIHAATAALIYGVPLEKVDKGQRIFAKRVNFGILYGMGAFRLARDSQMPLAQAREFIDTYFRQLPGVKHYIDSTTELAREQGFLATLYGRRRTFPGLRAGGNERAAAEREAINMPIQGTAADIIKLAMIQLQRELVGQGLRGRMILQVHDELVLEVPEDEVERTSALVVEVMEHAVELDAPLKANASVGVNWRDVE